MPLGWESKTRYMGESIKLEGGKFEFGVGNSRAPHPLYETLDAPNISVPFEHHHPVEFIQGHKLN